MCCSRACASASSTCLRIIFIRSPTKACTSGSAHIFANGIDWNSAIDVGRSGTLAAITVFFGR